MFSLLTVYSLFLNDLGFSWMDGWMDGYLFFSTEIAVKPPMGGGGGGTVK